MAHQRMKSVKKKRDEHEPAEEAQVGKCWKEAIDEFIIRLRNEIEIVFVKQ